MARKRSLLNEDLRLYTNHELETVVKKISKELETRKSLTAILDQSRTIMSKFNLTPEQFLQMVKRAHSKSGAPPRSQENFGTLEKFLMDNNQTETNQGQYLNDQEKGPEI